MSSINSVNAGNTDNTKFGKLDPINAQIEALANSIPKQAHSKEDLENGLEVKNKIIELKKQLIRKQEMEQKNQELYSYMHSIFGADVINLFDGEYGNKESKEDG